MFWPPSVQKLKDLLIKKLADFGMAQYEYDIQVISLYQMGLDTRKPECYMQTTMEQTRLRDAHSDQQLCYLLYRKDNGSNSYKQTFNIPASLYN